MCTDLTETGIVGVERVLRAERESHTGCHETRDECEENGRRMGELRENTSGAQCYNKRGGRNVVQ